MGIGTLFRYLIGDRAAILAVAANPQSLMIGLLFVLSAGFAREYDGEDLLHDPWYLMLPLAASLGSSFLLFCVLYGATALKHLHGPSFIQAYGTFLSLFWLTAPLAWLYAIPYERLLEPVPAVRANLLTLALVATWRVALMVRVAVVLMGMSPLAALFRVMAFADGVALLAVFFLPFPIIDIMSGTHLTEAESAVRGAAQFVGCWGSLSFVIWLVLAFCFKPNSHWLLPLASDAVRRSISRPLSALAFLSLAIWVGILPFTQPEQQLRRSVEKAIQDGRLADGLALMSAHQPDEFPPHWDPPPRFLKGEHISLIYDIWEEILKNDVAPWVRKRYLEKLRNEVAHNHFLNVENVAHLINRLPEGPPMLHELANEPAGIRTLELLDPYLRDELRVKTKANGQ
jgi:hypothetical protein